MRRGWIRCAPVVLIALLAGCSGANATNTPPAQNTASTAPAVPDTRCTALITDAEMQKTTGIKDIALVASNGQPNTGEQYCPYHSNATSTTVLLSIFTGAGLDGTFTAMDKTADAQNAEAISGIGDMAKWQKDAVTMLTKTKQTGISIIVQNSAPIKDAKKTTSAIAKLVVSRV
jgi:hypothetical protein